MRTISVTATLQRLGDPQGLGRSYYALHGKDMPHGVALIVYPRRERVYLKAEHALVPLFVHGPAARGPVGRAQRCQVARDAVVPRQSSPPDC